MSNLDTILGLTNIKRVVKEEMPPGYQLTSEALSYFSRASAIFTLYLASTASDLSRERHRRNITAADVRKALEEIDLPEFVDALSGDLQGFQEKKLQKRREGKARRDAATAGGEEGEVVEVGEGGNDDGAGVHGEEGDGKGEGTHGGVSGALAEGVAAFGEGMEP